MKLWIFRYYKYFSRGRQVLRIKRIRVTQGGFKMSKFETPFRYDYVGSFLRPEVLKEARANRNAKKISREELRKVEDACITDLIEKQKALGYHVITDGEFRRSYWHLDFMWGLNGIEE
jgi:vitamin-B12 independent methionine synthase family protein